MKQYAELTRIGRIRRMRHLAQAALHAYGLSGARIRLLREAGNTLFRVTESRRPAATTPANALFAGGQYLLRIHQPGYQTTDAIALELAWLAAMCRDANLPVPEPVPARDGGLLPRVCSPGIPEGRDCSLLRWVKGRFVTKGIRPHHFRAQGRLMARLHRFAACWRPPPGLTKRHYDWDGLFRGDSGSGFRASEVWPLLPKSYVEPFEAVARDATQIMKKWGKGPDVYGLIHADLGVDANVIFCGGEARAIDFDDSGYGYWVYDLAVSLEHCREDAAFPGFRDALLDGYAEIRPVPEEHLQHLGLFMAALDVYWSLWAVGMMRGCPSYGGRLRERLERTAGHVIDYVTAG